MAIRLKQNDSPTITHTFVNSNDEPIDLSTNGPYGAPDSVRVYIETTGGGLIVNDTATIENATKGKLSYDLSTDETPDTGLYNVEWEADFGTVDNRELMLTSPPQGYQKIGVDRTLGTVNAGTLSKRTLTSSVNADGYDFTNVNILQASRLQSADTGDSADVDSILAATGGGTSVALDLGNDDNIESNAITEIATDNDSNNIVVEQSAGKVLFDFAKKWPTAASVATGGLTPDALDSTNSPSGGQVPTFDTGTSSFKWADAPTGGSSTKEISETVSLPAGGKAEWPIFHKFGETIELNRWAISLTDGGSDSDLQLEFNPPPTGDAPTSTLELNNPIKDVTGNPIDSHTAGDTENAVVRLTANHTNSAGTDYQAGAGNGAVQVSFIYERL